MKGTPLATTFEGQQLITLDVGGQPGWDAQHIGEVLGYGARGQRLVKRIGNLWLDDLLHGHDYLKVERGMVLFKSGLDLVLWRSDKPSAQLLRRHVVDEVLPTLDREDLENGEVPSRFLVDRERRLSAKLELNDRRFRCDTLRHVARALRDLGQLDDNDFVICELAAVDIALRGVPDALDKLGAA